MPLLSCQNLTLAYNGHPAAENISFEVNSGDYLCVVGENGSGKSTLLKGLLGLKAPQSGRVAPGDGLLPGQVGYLPQHTAPQKDFPASVWEVVLSGRLNRKRLFYSKADRAAAMENLETLGIAPLKNKSYRALSGGQRQRVLLARALCATTRLLLLDEPASGLDPAVTRRFYGLLARLNREAGVTVVMVSHDLDGALSHATHILHLARRQLYFGPAAGWAESPAATALRGGEVQ